MKHHKISREINVSMAGIHGNYLDLTDKIILFVD